MAGIDSFWGPHDVEAWVPSLRYLLRRARILALMHDLPRGRLLEVGCGSGALLIELLAMGFHCVGLETSQPARALARHLCERHGVADPAIVTEPAPEWAASFDVVAAFDVLEHIADDRAAIAQWVRWLRPGGRLLLSVPAHSRRWNAGDEWAGHYRRYERDQLRALLAREGLTIEKMECYGFPFANLTEALGAFYYRRALNRRASSSTAYASALSGVDRKPWIAAHGLLQSWPGKAAVRTAIALQKPFLGTELGSGYLVLATKSCAA